MKKLEKKHYVYFGLAIVGAAIGYAVAKDRAETAQIRKWVFEPFRDMSKDEAVDLLKRAIDGTATITDAQKPIEGGYMIFIDD